MKELNELAYKNSISITHRHIISIVNTLIKEKLKKKHIRILDAGFGQAKLLKYLHDFLPKFNPEITFEVFGFDISDQDRAILNSYRPLSPYEYAERGAEFLATIDNQLAMCKFCPENLDYKNRLFAVSKKEAKKKFTLEPI
jgi:hypothetical protein